MIELPSDGIDRSRITERSFRLGEDAHQEIWLVCEEGANILRAFCLITLLTCQREVTDAVIYPNSARDNMFNLQWHSCFPAIGTCASPLLQQVFAHLIAEERPLLILRPTDFWMLSVLKIELD